MVIGERRAGPLPAICLAAALLVAAPAGQKDQPPPLDARSAAELSRVEALVAADPDNLRTGAMYRQMVIATWQHDRAFRFLDDLVRKHPSSANVLITAGLARVDRLPRVGTMGQISLGRRIIDMATRSIAVRPTWPAFLMRGRVYMGFKAVVDVGDKGLPDLEQARRLQRTTPPCALQAQIFVTLGDAYFVVKRPSDARRVWQEGLELFKDQPDLAARAAAANDTVLKALTSRTFNPWKRVDTGTSAPCD
jgi:hypothetical protein